MTNDREKTGDDPEDGSDEQDRPTVAPPFDPIAFAQEVLGGTPSPPAGTPAVAEAEAEPEPVDEPKPKEPVRASSRPTPPPPSPRPKPARTREPTLAEIEAAKNAVRSPIGRRATPGGLLSLANQRIPSNLPPRKESIGALDAVEKEWVELATRPPPPGAMDETPPDLDDDDRNADEGATKPPPPHQQALIDATSLADNPPSTKQAPDLVAAAARASAASGAPAARSVPAESGPPTAQEMNDRVSLGDYSGALEIAEKLLALDPSDAAAEACAESCRDVLRKMYTARIGPLDRVPMVMVARDQLRWLSIDHRAGFVLSLVDGVSSLEMILDVSGMPELDALRILSELAQQRIISFR
ncbi:MAG: hypothetical protein KF819_20295 [Labilithrix sp.]|nr:hypothetical protein [Labilithrix sp.]